jgi:hypothetical protein
MLIRVRVETLNKCTLVLLNLVHGDIIAVGYSAPQSMFFDTESGNSFNIAFTVGDLGTDISFSRKFSGASAAIPTPTDHLTISTPCVSEFFESK